jgi:plasmid stability protein
MSKMIQLRHVPDDLHRKLKARAAKAGMSLSDYVIREIAPFADLPSMEEWLDKLHTRTPIKLAEPSAVTIRRLRDSR